LGASQFAGLLTLTPQLFIRDVREKLHAHRIPNLVNGIQQKQDNLFTLSAVCGILTPCCFLFSRNYR
jgi:hypothetical protein